MQPSSGQALAPVQRQCLLVLLLAAAAAAATAPPQQQQAQLLATDAATPQQQQQLLRQPSPPVWPQRFRATLFQNHTNKLALTTLWYSWPDGANLNIIASQLGGTVYDLEFNNGTSFIFSRDEPACKTLTFDVGILYPSWLANSSYLGQTSTDTFVTDVWTKADFITYYADAATGRPVRWTFLWSGAEFHVLSFDEHAAPPHGLWQAPAYCFDRNSSSSGAGEDSPVLQQANGRMLRLLEARKQVAAAAAQRVQQRAQQQRRQRRAQPRGVQAS